MKTIKLLIASLFFITMLSAQCVNCTFTIPFGDSIYPGDNYDTIQVCGLKTPYGCRQLQKVEFSIFHDSIQNIEVVLVSPPPYNAEFYMVGYGYPAGSCQGKDIINATILNGGCVDIWDSAAPYTGVFADHDISGGYTFDAGFGSAMYPVYTNGNWIVHTYNFGTTPAYLAEFKLTFNY